MRCALELNFAVTENRLVSSDVIFRGLLSRALISSGAPAGRGTSYVSLESAEASPRGIRYLFIYFFLGLDPDFRTCGLYCRWRVREASTQNENSILHATLIFFLLIVLFVQDVLIQNLVLEINTHIRSLSLARSRTYNVLSCILL